MGRPKKSAAKHLGTEDEGHDIPDEEPARVIEPEPLTSGAVSQSDAVRAALDAGYEQPAEAVRYIMDRFGIEMNPQYFSAIKTRTKAIGTKTTEPAKRATKPKAAAPVAEDSAAPCPKVAACGLSDLMTALEGVKELVGQFGADQFKRMVDLNPIPPETGSFH